MIGERNKNTIQFEVIPSLCRLRKEVKKSRIEIYSQLKEVSLKDLSKVKKIRRESVKGGYNIVRVTFKEEVKELSSEIVLTEFNQLWRGGL